MKKSKFFILPMAIRIICWATFWILVIMMRVDDKHLALWTFALMVFVISVLLIYVENLNNVHDDIIDPRRFKTWKTIKFGMHKRVWDLLVDLNNRGFMIDDFAENILKKIPLAQTETEIELVLIPATKLGFNKAASRDLIYNRAKELGLDIVPAEVGPQLRLQYADQPMNKWIAIAMEPIADLRDHPNIFILSHPTDSRCLWLRVVYGHTSDMWNPYNYWVFTRRK